MQTVSAEQTALALPFATLVPALRDGFARGATTPPRHHHVVNADADATLLLMPSWTDGEFLGVKLVNVFPGNNERGLPALSSAFVLASAVTGEHLAVIDGNELTRRRTVATSALAASYLARPDSRVHLVVGTGHIGSLVPAAYASVLELDTVLVHDRDADRAARFAAELREQGHHAEPVADLAAAARRADVITCATLATEPIIRGEWLRPGTHLDLIGSFRRTMRESDDECVRRGTVYVDTPVACDESGDLTQPIAAGVLDPAAIAGDLAQLCRDELPGRRDADEITVFKTVGSGLADLTAAALAYRHDH
ncbi:ornithine cyclodeaminase family protein [Prauserella cavernicola]|uniref:Ornithine cyclodeaminase family protein n=1 Tax=Prauserella cavernicola TaxID=2800127 RepID=A0A934V337_9PSEU|nr:ornithine cyclodeaminase family protein [Prauserella cavernicola]MBK1783867.1 ornithine cyclodeaminase family protein [Prauserella cavernicola]